MGSAATGGHGLTSLETSATLPGECGKKMVPPLLFMPMSFSMSKYCVIIIISITSRLLMSAGQPGPVSTSYRHEG